MNLFEVGFKFVILDEVDYMTKNAQQALKYLLQTTTTDVRFCLICNYISKIDEPLKNELREFINSIQTRQNPLTDHNEALKVQTVMEMIDKKLG